MKLTWALFLFLVPLAVFASGGTPAPAAGGHGGGGGEAAAPKKPLPPPAIPAPENISTTIHLAVNNLTKAQPPRVMERKLVLTWKGDSQPRYVAAAFGHEAYRQKHVFWRNQNGVYFLVMDLASDTPANLQYRLIVDGLWQADPANPSRSTDAQGVAMSLVSLGSADLPAHHGPTQGPRGEVTFAYHGKAGVPVSIVGDFNQWDPFSHFLEETHPGEFHLTVTLPPGTVLYRLVVGNKSILDPTNLRTGHDDQGGTFSFFENQYTVPAQVLDAKMAVAAAHH